MPASESPGVLVVDDQADMRALLQTVLRHLGFRVWLADGGKAALALYRVHRDEIAVVLLDVVMPEWDGPKTLAEIKAVNPMAVCCFVTGESASVSADSLIAMGAAHVVRKPFEPVALARTLWSLCGPRDRRSDRPRYERQSTKVRVGAGLEPAHVVESWVSDASPGGLRLRLPERIGEVGSILSIRPADADDDAPWIPVQVRHGRADGGGWTIGCQILHPAALELLRCQPEARATERVIRRSRSGLAASGADKTSLHIRHSRPVATASPAAPSGRWQTGLTSRSVPGIMNLQTPAVGRRITLRGSCHQGAVP